MSLITEVYLPALDFDQLSLKPYEAAKVALGHSGQVYKAFLDLNCHLIVNSSDRSFIASDNPSFKYNLYCETVTGTGTLGAAQSGFMMFTSLSSRHLIFLYDREVYKVTPIHNNVNVVDSLHDINQLNKMQVVNADCNLLFSKWSECDAISELARKFSSLRKHRQMIVQNFMPADGRDDRAIIHTHETDCRIGTETLFSQYPQRCQAYPN